MNAALKISPVIARGIEMNPGLDLLISSGSLRTFRPGTPLFFAGEEAHGLFCIVSGSVSVLVEDEDRLVTYDFIGAGEFVGEGGLFSDDLPRRRSATVRARTPTRAVYVTYDQVMRIAEVNPRILVLIGSNTVKRLAKTSRRLKNMMNLDVKDRLHHVLMDLSRHPDAVTHPDGMQIRITRSELGTIVGCSREMAGRALKHLAANGAVSAQGKTIVIYGTR